MAKEAPGLLLVDDDLIEYFVWPRSRSINDRIIQQARRSIEVLGRKCLYSCPCSIEFYIFEPESHQLNKLEIGPFALTLALDTGGVGSLPGLFLGVHTAALHGGVEGVNIELDLWSFGPPEFVKDRGALAIMAFRVLHPRLVCPYPAQRGERGHLWHGGFAIRSSHDHIESLLMTFARIVREGRRATPEYRKPRVLSLESKTKVAADTPAKDWLGALPSEPVRASSVRACRKQSALLLNEYIAAWELGETERLKHAASLDAINTMGSLEFEEFVGRVFSSLGYSVETTAHSGDEGIDLMLKKDGKLRCAQVKLHSKPIGQPVIRDFFGAMQHLGAAKGYVVTNNTFSLQAERFAEGKPIELVDGSELTRLASEIVGGQDS